MKKILIAVSLFVGMIAVYPAIFSYGGNGQPEYIHAPRHGDRLNPDAVRPSVLVAQVEDSARTIVLNPEASFFKNPPDVSVYLDGDTISYVYSATKHRFLLRGDTLMYLGYENRSTDFHLDRPLRMAIFPLTDGQEVSDSWKGYVHHHGSRLLKRMAGISESLVQGGHSIVDGTDTLGNLTRLSWTLDMSYADPDSLDQSDPDSVASDKISEMKIDVKSILSERLLTERAVWFSEEARYPVLTETNVSRITQNPDGESVDTVAFSELACYYPTSNQYYDTGEEIIGISPSGAPRHGTSLSSHEDNDENPGDLISVGQPEISDLTVSIPLSSKSGSKEATVSIYSDSGMLLSEPVSVTLVPVSRDFRFPLPADWKGVLILVVDPGENSVTRKIIR